MLVDSFLKLRVYDVMFLVVHNMMNGINSQSFMLEIKYKSYGRAPQKRYGGDVAWLVTWPSEMHYTLLYMCPS